MSKYIVSTENINGSVGSNLEYQSIFKAYFVAIKLLLGHQWVRVWRDTNG